MESWLQGVVCYWNNRLFSIADTFKAPSPHFSFYFLTLAQCIFVLLQNIGLLLLCHQILWQVNSLEKYYGNFLHFSFELILNLWSKKDKNVQRQDELGGKIPMTPSLPVTMDSTIFWRCILICILVAHSAIVWSDVKTVWLLSGKWHCLFRKEGFLLKHWHCILLRH